MILLFASLAGATPVEDEILAEMDRGNLLTARRLAEPVYRDDPDNIVANLALGRAYALEDGILGKARYHLERADDVYDARYGSSSDAPWKQHADILFYLAYVAELQEDGEAQLAIYDHHDAEFDPDALADRAWTLMKLGRESEARMWAQIGLDSGDAYQIGTAHNALCALEAEAGHRIAASTACRRAYEHELGLPEPDLTVDAANAGLSALQTLDFRASEQLLLRATEGRSDSASNPWAYLLHLHLLQGRGADAATDVQRVQGWRAHTAADMRDQSRAALDADLAAFALVAGRPDKSLELVTRAITFPDRRAMNSESGDQALGSALALRITARIAADARAAEEASTGGLWTRWTHALSSWMPDFADWSDRRRVAALLVDDRMLRRTLRPYLDGGLGVPRWRLGDLFPVLGHGVVQHVLDAERPMEEQVEHGAYYDAAAAEMACQRRDTTACRDLVRTALSTLPPPEVLLRARLTALAADAAWRDGDTSAALADYEEALLRDPSVYRRLDLPLPATVIVRSGDGSLFSATPADLAGDMLRRSPRLTSAARAFTVTLDGAADNLSICLVGVADARLSCTDVDRPPPEEGEEPINDDAFARLAVTRFYDRAFGLPVGGAQVDLDSLDASPQSAGEAGRERAQEILEGL